MLHICWCIDVRSFENEREDLVRFVNSPSFVIFMEHWVFGSMSLKLLRSGFGRYCENNLMLSMFSNVSLCFASSTLNLFDGKI